LAHLLADADEDIRIAGIESLAEIGTAACLTLIQQCLDDPAGPVRENASYWYHEVAKIGL